MNNDLINEIINKDENFKNFWNKTNYLRRHIKSLEDKIERMRVSFLVNDLNYSIYLSEQSKLSKEELRIKLVETELNLKNERECFEEALDNAEKWHKAQLAEHLAIKDKRIFELESLLKDREILSLNLQLKEKENENLNLKLKLLEKGINSESSAYDCSYIN